MTENYSSFSRRVHAASDRLARPPAAGASVYASPIVANCSRKIKPLPRMLSGEAAVYSAAVILSVAKNPR